MKDSDLLAQQSLMESYLARVPRPLSSFSFVSVFAWCDFFDFEFKVFEDHLCIFAKSDGGVFLYLPPLGVDLDVVTLDKVFSYMAQGGRLRPVNRIENIPEYLLSAFDLGLYNQYLKPVEYVYRKEDLITLKGNRYKSKRHDCNCFQTRYARHSFRVFEEADLDACLELYQQWAKDRETASSDDVFLAMLQENHQVHARLLKFHKPLGLVVRLLLADDKIIGYTFGFALDKDTFCIYAEIADHRFTGASAFMFKSFCEDQALKTFCRINAMDDFAMPKVAQTKQSYHPTELIKSYSVTLRDRT